MASDFVTPKAHRLTLHDGEYVDIQVELNHGDSEDMNARIWPSGGLDRRMVRTARLLAYLLGWSLTRTDADGETRVPVPYALDLPEAVRLDTIRALSHVRAIEIFDAIEHYEEQRDAARAAEKKLRLVRTAPPADAKTSPSPSVPDGASTGFVPSASTITPNS